MEIFTLILSVMVVGLLILTLWNPEKGRRLHYVIFLLSAISMCQALVDTDLTGSTLSIVFVLNLLTFFYALAGMIRNLSGRQGRR